MAYSKPNAKAKKQLKGMLKLPAKQFGQTNNFVYYDKNKKKWWFVDFEGDLMELKNDYYLKQISDYIMKKQININESVKVFDERHMGKYTILMLRDGNTTRSAIFKNNVVNNYNRNKQSDVDTIWDLAGKYKNKPIEENQISEESNSRDERDAIEFYTNGVGKTLHKKFKGKFHLNMFNQVLEGILEKVKSPTSNTRLNSVIKLWSRNLNLNVENYLDGDIIEDEKFIEDAQKQAEKYYKIYTSSLSENVITERTEEPTVITDLRWIVKNSQNKKVTDPSTGKKVRVDLFTASAIITVYDAINPANKKKFITTPIGKMSQIAFKLLG